MRKLLFLIAVGFGVWHWNGGELPFMKKAGAFDEAGNPVVWLFTVKECGKPCQVMRNELKRRRVRYEEKMINPDNSDDPNVKLWKDAGRGGFPFTVAGSERIAGSGSKLMLQELLGPTFGDRYLTASERQLLRRHFYSDGSPKVVLYGTDWCPHCKKLREDLNANGIDFLEIDVDKSAYKKRIVDTLEVYGYPAVWVGYKRLKDTSLRSVKKAIKSL